MIFVSLTMHFRFCEILLQTSLITFETVDFPKLNALGIFSFYLHLRGNTIYTQSFFLSTGTALQNRVFCLTTLDQLIDKDLQKIFLTFENSQSIPGLVRSHSKHYPNINILVLILPPNILLSFFQFFLTKRLLFSLDRKLAVIFFKLMLTLIKDLV